MGPAVFSSINRHLLIRSPLGITCRLPSSTGSSVPFTPAPASNSAAVAQEPATPRPARVADFGSSLGPSAAAGVAEETPAPSRSAVADAGTARELGAGAASDSAEFSQEQVSALARAMQLAMGGGGAAVHQQDEGETPMAERVERLPDTRHQPHNSPTFSRRRN